MSDGEAGRMTDPAPEWSDSKYAFWPRQSTPPSLRLLIEACIHRFEPRIVSLKVTLVEATDKVSGTLRLRVDALLRADPAPEPIAFDTVVDLVTKNVTILEKET